MTKSIGIIKYFYVELYLQEITSVRDIMIYYRVKI